MPGVLLALLLSAPPPLHEHAFHLDHEAEAVATVTASCERCDWGAKGREAAVLTLAVDGVPSPHLVLFRGAPAAYRVLLGPLGAGPHRLTLARDAKSSARGAGAVRVEAVAIEAVSAGEPGYEGLAHAPILHTRPGSLDRFSDVPLLAWLETRVSGDGGRELRYSVVFSHEDGGTPLDRLMATWGRATDIELVYAVEVDAEGRVRREEYQGKDHVIAPFRGGKEGRHPVLYVVTKNNLVRDRGRRTPRVAPAPRPFSLDGASREAVMDAHPWTYRVSGQEVRREGRVARAPGRRRIRDPRVFAYVEACAEVRDARIAFDLGFPAPGGGLWWAASDARGQDFRVGRGGCFRAAVAMPEGSALSDARTLRFRAHTRPARRGERPLPPGSGSVRLDRVTRLFGLGPDDAPGPSVFAWSAGAELRPDGASLELPIGAAPPADGASSVPAAVPLAPP
jgi:hypothetical protein